MLMFGSGLTCVSTPDARHVDTGMRTLPDALPLVLDALERHSPSVAFFMPGLRDAQSMLHAIPGAVSPERFEQACSQLVREAMTRSSARIVLLDPYYAIGRAEACTYRAQVLDAIVPYTQIVRETAQRFQCAHVPTQHLFENEARKSGWKRLAHTPERLSRAGQHFLWALIQPHMDAPIMLETSVWNGPLKTA